MPLPGGLSELLPDTSIYLQLARFVVVFAAGIVFTRAAVMPAIAVLLRRRGAAKTTRHSIVNIGGIVGFFLSFTVALQAGNFGNLVTVLGTVAAAMTVAIGFGMRDQISNLLAGLFIFLDSPFIKGEYIKTTETEGVVREISLRSTTLEGSSSQKVVVPNSQLTMEELKNYTRGSKTKCAVRIELPNEHIEEGTELLEELATQQPDVLTDPRPDTFYTDADGRIASEVHFWVSDPADVKPSKSTLLESFNRIASERGLFETDAESADSE